MGSYFCFAVSTSPTIARKTYDYTVNGYVWGPPEYRSTG